MMKNDFFTVTLNHQTGNVASIVINDDADRMNWCGMTHEWGELVNHFGRQYHKPFSNKLISFHEDETGSQSVFSNERIKVTVTRSFTERGTFKENYTFENLVDGELFIRKGELGIYTTFNDIMKSADISQKECCNTHIWCGENGAWINALKQGISKYNIGVVLTKGSIDAYTIDRANQTITNYKRGNILLHPDAIELMEGESFTVEWEMFIHSGNDDFKTKIEGYGKVYPVAKYYTVYPEEPIEFTFKSNAEHIKVELNQKEVQYERSGDLINVRYVPQNTGEHKFYIYTGNEKTHININTVNDFETILERRINFIVDHQQYERKGSHLDGAYLIYDTKENRVYYDKLIVDHNACRERLGMALLITRYLQTHKNEKFYNSLMRFVKFAKREILDCETGEVYNSEGKNKKTIRLYNAPWMITLLSELYNLTNDEEYLEIIYKSVEFYYKQGGETFYPNGLSMKLTVDALRKGGKDKYAGEVTELFAKHVRNMINTGLNYPPMEAIFEQTIVTPAVTYICEMGLITGDKEYKEHILEHLKVLDRFDGMQPDYRTNGIPIRYWDDFWFGKSELYADTLHYWSCLSARSWNTYYLLSGDASYREKALNCMRNCLCLFMENGMASCAYVTPFKVDSYNGEFYDEWANDQDFALYFALVIM